MPPGRNRETWGDFAREEARRQGLLYFGDVDDDVRSLLTDLQPDARREFALACAERAMARHVQLPQDQQRGFTIEWQAVLAAIRAGLEGDAAAAARVRAGLDAFHAGPYDHAAGQDGPDDADDDAAAAAIYAAECFLNGETEPAWWAAGRSVEMALAEAEDREAAAPTPERLARENLAPGVQAELRRQLDDLAALRDGNRLVGRQGQP
jgi:hypothetical protein